MRVLGLIAAASILAINAFANNNVPNDNERHWEFNLAPQYVHQKIHADIDQASLPGDKFNMKGSSYGLTASIATVMEDSWYLGLHGDWHTGKLRTDISMSGVTFTDKIKVDTWRGDVRFGYHFSMGQDMLDVGITPFVGVGYDKQKERIPGAAAALLGTGAPEYTRGVGLVGFMSNYNWDECFSLGLNATLEASFSSEAKDKSAVSNPFGKLKNVVNGSVEVPIGYAFKSQSMQVLDSISVVPFYQRYDWGASKANPDDLPKITNKQYGVRLEVDLYF